MKKRRQLSVVQLLERIERNKEDIQVIKEAYGRATTRGRQSELNARFALKKNALKTNLNLLAEFWDGNIISVKFTIPDGLFLREVQATLTNMSQNDAVHLILTRYPLAKVLEIQDTPTLIKLG